MVCWHYKEVSKLAIARFLAEPAAQALLEAELRTWSRFNMRRDARLLIDANQVALDLLATHIAELRLATPARALVMTSETVESFYADIRARFELHLREDAVLPSGFNPVVRLGDITLERDQATTSLVWHVRADSDFPPDGDGYLPLTIEFQ